MTFNVHKAIKEFRLANRLSQKKLAAKIGLSHGYLSMLETGRYYPSPWTIAKLNELGANIHSSIFSHFTHKLTLAIQKMKVPRQRFGIRWMTVQVSKKECLWIKELLAKEGITYKAVAEKAGCVQQTVTAVLNGRDKSRKLFCAIAEILNFDSLESLLAAYKQEKATKTNFAFSIENFYKWFQLFKWPVPQKKRSVVRDIDPKSLIGVKASDEALRWIKAQLHQHRLHYRNVAEKAGISIEQVKKTMRGRYKSKLAQEAIAAALEFESFEELLAIYRQEQGGMA